LWTRDIQLLPEQIANLESNRSRGREKYSETRKRQREDRETRIRAQAKVEYESLSRNPGFMFGLALYIGEGTKTTRGSIVLSNCDPRVLRKFASFLQILGVPKEKLRARISLHPHLSEEQAVGFWSLETGVPRERFTKTSRAVSRASKGLKLDRQPYGTCSVYYGSTELWLKIQHWMDMSLS
jgi:hypothetical protein